jgi:hypothetical protein
MVSSTSNADFQRAAPSPNNKIHGLVVLLYGRGGFGKSTLLRRYRDIALRENQAPLSSRILVSDVIDWEFAAEGKRSLFNVQAESELNVTEYFKALSSQLAYALGKKPQDFKMYQSTLRDVERAGKMANDVLDNCRKITSMLGSAG